MQARARSVVSTQIDPVATDSTSERMDIAAAVWARESAEGPWEPIIRGGPSEYIRSGADYRAACR
jgi:hypothetical protein